MQEQLCKNNLLAVYKMATGVEWRTNSCSPEKKRLTINITASHDEDTNSMTSDKCLL